MRCLSTSWKPLGVTPAPRRASHHLRHGAGSVAAHVRLLSTRRHAGDEDDATAHDRIDTRHAGIHAHYARDASAHARVHASSSAAAAAGAQGLLHQLHGPHGADEEGQEPASPVSHAQPSPESTADAQSQGTHVGQLPGT